jgi:hypothetical protein
MIDVYYNPNAHAELGVNALLDFPFKGFILRHFEWVVRVVQHGLLIHTKLHNSEFNVGTYENMN